jgi:hypothetical protein
MEYEHQGDTYETVAVKEQDCANCCFFKDEAETPANCLHPGGSIARKHMCGVNDTIKATDYFKEYNIWRLVVKDVSKEI